MKKVIKTCLALLFFLTIIFANQAQEIQRVRIDFETPNGFVRHLLLGFTPNNAASDGYNYGYDALNTEDFPDDLNWLVDDMRCVIQGVGAFENTKVYPLGLYISNPGTIRISLTSLENFTDDIDVFVYDKVNETYSKINDTYFENATDTGEFQDRYSIAFKESTLSSEDIFENEFTIKYLRNSEELLINSNFIDDIEQLNIYNVIGQRVLHQSQLKSNRIKLNINSNKSNVYIVHLKTSKGMISKRIII